MASGLGALIDYGSDDEVVKESSSQVRIVSTEEVYAEDGEGSRREEPIPKKRRLNDGEEIDSAVDSFLAEIGNDLENIADGRVDDQLKSEEASDVKENNAVEPGNDEDDENIDGEEIPFESLPVISTTFESAVIEEPQERLEEESHSLEEKPSIQNEKCESAMVELKKEEPDVKLPYFKLANRCANAMKSTLNVRSIQMEEYGGFRVYLRYDDIPICLLSSMGQHQSEITARRTAVKEFVGQMFDLGLFPPNTKKILAEKITTVEKMIEVIKPVLSYLKFQISDQRYQRMLRDDQMMSIKADCTRVQLELISGLIDQMKYFTYRFYAEPTNNPWVHLAPAESVAPSVYTTKMISGNEGGRVTPTGNAYGISPAMIGYEVKEEQVYGIDNPSFSDPSLRHIYTVPPPLNSEMNFPTAPPTLAAGMKLRIIEDNTDSRPPGSHFSLPSTSLPSLPTASGFQSQYVRTVAVMSSTVVKEEAISAALRISVPKHEVISEIVERTIGALGWTERNDTIMVGNSIRKRAYLWVDEVPISILGAMGESDKLSEAVSTCTHELMEQLCAWSLFPLDMVSQICRNKDYLNALLFSMSNALSFITSVLREPQYMALHITQGMARVPLEAPAPHQAVAISFRCRVKSFMDKFWESHKIPLGPLIPLPKLEQWERVYFVHTESMDIKKSPHDGEDSTAIESEKSSINLPWTESGDVPDETEEYL